MLNWQERARSKQARNSKKGSRAYLEAVVAVDVFRLHVPVRAAHEELLDEGVVLLESLGDGLEAACASLGCGHAHGLHLLLRGRELHAAPLGLNGGRDWIGSDWIRLDQIRLGLVSKGGRDREKEKETETETETHT